MAIFENDNKFKIVQELNKGNYGKVYVAVCSETQRMVALKVEIKKPYVVNTLIEEAKILKKINQATRQCTGFPQCFSHGE